MSRDSVLARGRAAAEAGMVDACTIRRRTDETSDSIGAVTGTYADLYAGKCRVQQTSPTGTQHDAGEAAVVLQPLTVSVPMSVTGLQPRDEITITGSEHDPDLVGRVFLIDSISRKTDLTARRVGAQERTR